MTTTHAPSPAEAIAAPARLTAYRDAALAPDAPIDATLAYLRELADADEASLISVPITDPTTRSKMARCELQVALTTVAHFLTTGLAADVRSAPASALAEVVRDSAAPCGNAHQGCLNNVLPWDGDGRHCSDECERDDERTRP